MRGDRFSPEFEEEAVCQLVERGHFVSRGICPSWRLGAIRLEFLVFLSTLSLCD